MSIADKLTTIAENQKKIYYKGKNDEWTDFWDSFHASAYNQNKSGKGLYGGRGWNDKTFKPKYSFAPTNAENMFRDSNIQDLAGILKKQGIVFDFKDSIYFDFFAYSSAITHFPPIDFRKADAKGYPFGYCTRTVSIEKVIYKDDGTTPFSNDFVNCTALENLVVEGVIGRNGFDVRYSTKLTHDSLMSIINALKDYSDDTSGTTYKVTLGSDNIEKLTQDEIQLIRNKGWEYA